MATINDSLNPPQPPTRVFYSTGRMLGVADFQADQDYHRGRLARALLQLYGTGTVSGLLVQTDGNTDPAQLEIQVTPGMAIDRLGRVIEAPRTVCIIPQNWLTQQVQAWQNQQTNPVPGQPSLPDPNTAIHDTKNLMVDVFATFVPCTRGATPCFATQDDYDATDAFRPNRWLDSFAMQLVLRTDSDPLTPLDPWYTAGAAPADPAALRQSLLQATAGPATAPQEYPPGFDATSVFLARILIPATAGSGGAPPVWNLDPHNIVIDNDSRLFLYPAALLARLMGLGSGAETKS
jgi:hypothetical protein